MPTEGAQIRYTLDGTNPSATVGLDYSGPINISTTTVLKAVAIKDNFLPSTVDSHTYIYADQVLQQDDTGLEGSVRIARYAWC